MDTKIMYGALLFAGGWCYFYFCLRQLIFDFTVGYPLINRFGAAGDSVLMKKPARNLNTVSVVVWLGICAGLAWVVQHFCPLYLLISFCCGVALGLILFFNKLGPATDSNLKAWLRTYYRFMPDDALRTAAYNTDYPKMRSALRALNVSVDVKL